MKMVFKFFLNMTRQYWKSHISLISWDYPFNNPPPSCSLGKISREIYALYKILTLSQDQKIFGLTLCIIGQIDIDIFSFKYLNMKKL